jgi:hypothetical protein
MKPQPLDLQKLKVYPLAQRESLTRVEDILVAPDAPPPPCPPGVTECTRQIAAARQRNAGVILMYGAHLLRNGAALILEKMMARGWLTHLATNGAGTIHDWEYAWLGRSTESVEKGVATGTFGTWDETSRYIHLALQAGNARGEGYGTALGRFIWEDGTDQVRVEHRWKHASILAQAFRHDVPMTVHPGIGYDIISNHPLFDGAVIGRAATLDFRLFGGSVETLDNGVVLSVGSAIMAPQVFEKSLSCVNNLRLQAGRPIVRGHTIYVVDIQDGGNWDWTKGEPPKTNPAYYLRFCKSFSRMGGTMHYVQADNLAFIHNLYHQLNHL